jgi:hypothetical protein
VIFIEDHEFQRRRERLLVEDEFFQFLEWLAIHPGSGRVIRGSGGLRKVRWAAKGHGKRGGVRIIYFWWLISDRILLLDIYAKSAKEDLAAAEIVKLQRKVIP